MSNHFFLNHGPLKIFDIFTLLDLKPEKTISDQNIFDINDLSLSNENEITFFHSKKYKNIANNTKASFCITTELLKDYLPKNCRPILVPNVLTATSKVTSKFYPEAIRSHGKVWKYKGEAFVENKKMADAIWSATIVDRK